MYRALKPTGRLQIADIMVSRAVPDAAKLDLDLCTGRIAGALLDAELQTVVVTAGFVDFEITWKENIYAGAPQESNAEN